MSEGLGGYVGATESLYGNLSYEQILGRAVDRALSARAHNEPIDFISAVKALSIAVVDLPGKPMKTEITAAKILIVDRNEGTVTDRYDLFFEEIVKILSKYKLLFKAVVLEVGREQF